MNFIVEKLILYDIGMNKKYQVLLPEDDLIGLIQFETTIDQLQNYNLLETVFEANPIKCKNCIYNLLCDKAAC